MDASSRRCCSTIHCYAIEFCPFVIYGLALLRLEEQPAAAIVFDVHNRVMKLPDIALLTPVVLLDWIGLDLLPDPIHPTT